MKAFLGAHSQLYVFSHPGSSRAGSSLHEHDGDTFGRTFPLVLHPAHHGTPTRMAADTGVCLPVSQVVPERWQRIESAPWTARYMTSKASLKLVGDVSTMVVSHCLLQQVYEGRLPVLGMREQ